MADVVSIKERVERVAVLIAQGMTGVGAVYRWDMRGLRDPETAAALDVNRQRPALKHQDAIVLVDSETAEEGGEGYPGYTLKKLPLEVQVKLGQDEDEKLVTAELVNRWLYKIEVALMANPLFIEPADVGNEERLAIDVRVTETIYPLIVEGQKEAMVGVHVEVQYQHNRDDPAIGPGITLLEE